MTALSATRQNLVILAVLLFAQLLLMAASSREAQGSTVLESWSMMISSPVVASARFVGGGLHELGSGIANLLYAHTRNSALESEVRRLSEELQAAREHRHENERLRRLLGMREEHGLEGVVGRVVTCVSTSQEGMIVVDRGAADGVLVDSPVVAWGGAVGRVVAVSPGHAKVQLLTDPNSGVSGVIRRTGAEGLVVGKGGKRLELRYLDRLAELAHGDRVVTSGLDGIYPKGFGIGLVATVKDSPDGRLTARLENDFDYKTLEEVMILPRPVNEDLLDEGFVVETP